MALVPGLEWTLKALVHRARPDGQGWGYPSGHAMASSTLALFMCLVLWPRFDSRRKLGVAVVSAVFVLGIAVSRVASGVHWPSDIVGGWMTSLAYVAWTAGVIKRDLVPSSGC